MIIPFNTEPPIETPVTIPKDWAVPNVGWRDAPIEHVYENTSPFIQGVLDQTPLIGEHKRVLVTLKLQQLEESSFTDVRKWHCDGWGNKRSPDVQIRPEYNHLFILGGAPVEFMIDPIRLLWMKGYSKNRFWGQLADYQTRPARPVRLGVFNTYDCFDLKRGVKTRNALTRLLIRVTETDKIQPNHDPVEPDRKED